MQNSLLWLSDRQWLRIAPNLPSNLTGPEREDDQCIISGIVHMLQSGGRWRDCPREDGPYTTVYNRFKRWAERGLWSMIFDALAEAGKDCVTLVLDSTTVKANRSVSGGKGGDAHKQSDAHVAGARRRSTL